MCQFKCFAPIESWALCFYVESIFRLWPISLIEQWFPLCLLYFWNNSAFVLLIFILVLVIFVMKRNYCWKSLARYILLLFHLLMLKIWWKSYLVAFWEYYLLALIKFCFINIHGFLFVWKGIKLINLIILMVLRVITFRIVNFIFNRDVFHSSLIRNNHISWVNFIFRLFRHWRCGWFEFTYLDASRHFSWGVCWLTFYL